MFLGVARSHYLINEGLTRFSFFTTALGAVVNVGLNLVLIPQYGGMGAAVASVVSYAASGYLSSFVYPRLFETGLMQSKAFAAPVRYALLFARKRSWL
ncbi:MAG: flippase, partial [Nitrospirae bacterium]|nr:flippase [Nitrospirota bacterium]